MIEIVIVVLSQCWSSFNMHKLSTWDFSLEIILEASFPFLGFMLCSNLQLEL